MAVKIHSLSKEYIKVPVSVEVNGADYDPTGDTVEFSFTTFADDADPTAWNIGDWETDPGPPIRYYGRVVIGTGGVVLAVGKYHVWVRITDSPEIPVRLVGVLTID